ncbi:NTP transferase domain-containing protein [Veillonellaceae bacterium WCA-693-APC-5D-A]|uniref:NTP transferase domain-containing protein n=1 Tax=Anaerovibrio slackiae TaxID=2652309 RepID=A0A6I2UIS5_9FIRM|nr:glycosyltransferase family 2 protein [Anaerovibrio slackiae]MSU09051.1 NTP transferase domain-containing protein [Anaerovibrio slackiae]
MLNIVIPMAGRGSRFANAGYKMPKPLIDVNGKPMIEWVTENIRPKCEHRFIYICQQEHLEKYNLADLLNRLAPGCQIVTVDHITEGAACTVLLAEKYIDNDEPMMMANSDQYVDTDINVYLAEQQGCDGLIMTMPANHPKWSYIRYNDEGLVTLVREKEVISDEATVGIYNYAHGKDFVRYAHQMIEKDIRVNGEFYVAPVYNEMIEAGKRIRFKDVGVKMHGLGTPEDLEAFLKTDLAKRK